MPISCSPPKEAWSRYKRPRKRACSIRRGFWPCSNLRVRARRGCLSTSAKPWRGTGDALSPVMTRRCEGTRLVVASHNPGKVREIDELIRPLGFRCVSAAELGLPEPEETGATFIENAALKASAAAGTAKLPALADDSGLVVPALGGAPGIHSARWAGPRRDFGLAMRRVESELGDAANRHAHFICALALAWPDGHV